MGVIAGIWLRCGLFMLVMMVAVMMLVVALIFSRFAVVLADEEGLRVLAEAEQGSLQADEKTHGC